jgi:hypothetical protein
MIVLRVNVEDRTCWVGFSGGSCAVGAGAMTTGRRTNGGSDGAGGGGFATERPGCGREWE